MNSEFSFAEILKNIDFYHHSTKDLEFNQNEPRSAVAVIVKKTLNNNDKSKTSDFIQDQILFLQRKNSLKDKFSGQICFPGGRQEPNQTLLQTAIRQTSQQTNIRLKPEQLIGCINRRFNLILPRDGKHLDSHDQIDKKKQLDRKQMAVYAFVFVLQDQQIPFLQIKLNEHEMEAYKWVPVSQLVKSQNISWLDYTQRFLKLAKSFIQNQLTTVKPIRPIGIYTGKTEGYAEISRALSPALLIGMGYPLYGLTLYILLSILAEFSKTLNSSLQQVVFSQLDKKSKIAKEIIGQINQIISRCQNHIIFQIKQPINERFKEFNERFFKLINKLRPKL